MFKKSFIVAAVTVAVGLAQISAHASDPTYEVGLGGSYFDYDDYLDFEASPGVRGLAAYRFTPAISAGLVVEQTQTELELFNLDVDAHHYFLEGLYHFNTDGRVQPYLSLGWGQLVLETDLFDDYRSSITTVGAGIKFRLAENWEIRSALNHFFMTEGEDAFYNVAAITLSYLWGGSDAPRKSGVVRAKDTDNDGVPDPSDACANTPSGAPVDTRGCALDTDADGVADYLDNCPATAARLKVDDRGCPVTLSETISINLKVNFDSGSAVVKPEFFSEIRKVADFMAQYENTRVEIQGHTDTSGAAAYNKSLSQRRASAVAAVLISEYGVAASRVDARGYGEEQPIADESTAAGRLANRRVVAQVSAQIDKQQAR